MTWVRASLFLLITVIFNFTRALLLQNIHSISLVYPDGLYENLVLFNVSSIDIHDSRIYGHVLIQNSENIRISSSLLYQGLEIRRSTNVDVNKNNITNNNGTCVYIPSCGNSTLFESCNITVSNNYIHDCHIPSNGTSPYSPVAQGILLGGNEGTDQVTVGVLIRNNLVQNVDEMGIRINNDNYGASILNIVTLNRIINWGMLASSEGGDSRDSGCIYLYGHWYGPGNVVSFNDCLVTNSSYGQNGIYLDDASTGQVITGNYFRNATYGSPIKLNGGSYNYIDSNIVIQGINLGFGNCRGIRGIPSMWYTCTNEPRWLSVLESNKYLSGLWGENFPWYRNWCNSTTAGPSNYLCAPPGSPPGYTCEALSRGNTIQHIVGFEMVYNNSFIIQNTGVNNTYSNGTGTCPQYVVTENFNQIDWSSTSAFYRMDQFVNSSSGDYTLRTDSDVYKDFPTFVRIPYMEIGPQ